MGGGEGSTKEGDGGLLEGGEGTIKEGDGGLWEGGGDYKRG